MNETFLLPEYNCARFTIIFGSEYSRNYRQLQFYLNNPDKPNDFQLVLRFTSKISNLFKWINEQIEYVIENLPETDTTKQINDTNKLDIIILFNIETQDDFIEQFNKLIEVNKKSRIIFMSVGFNQYFSNLILDRRNKVDINSKYWPKYCMIADKLLHFISEENKFYIIDDDKQDAYQPLIEFIQNYYINKNIFLNKSVLTERINTLPTLYNNNIVMELVHKNKSRFFRNFHDLEKEWNNKLALNDYNVKMRTIDEILDLNESRNIWSHEEKSVFKNIIALGKNEKSSNTICSRLMIEGISIVKSISKFSKKFDNPLDNLNVNLNKEEEEETLEINRLHRIVDLLYMIGSHFLFCHSIFNDTNYINLIREMIESTNYFVQIESTKLIFKILERDHKRYGSLFIENDRSHPESKCFVKQILKLIFYSFRPILLAKNQKDNNAEQQLLDSTTSNDDNEIEFFSFLNDNLIIGSLELLLKGSFENCKKISQEDFKTLVDISLILKSPIFSSRIYAILNMLLKYGSIQLWQHVDLIKILIKVNTTVRCFVQNRFFNKFWKQTTSFLKDLLVFIEKGESINERGSLREDGRLSDDDDDNNDYFDEEENDGINLQTKNSVDEIKTLSNQSENDNNPEETEALGAKNLTENVTRDQCLIDLVYNFKKKLSKSKSDDRLKILRDQKEFALICIENRELKFENEELKSQQANLECKIQNLKSELERLEKDRNARIDECVNLRMLNETNKKTIDSIVCDTKQNQQQTDNDASIGAQLAVEAKPKNKEDLSNLNENTDEALLINNVEENKIEITTAKLARDFIESIGKKRKNLKEFRKLICGTLNHLGANLYSSPMHFLSEIIQNFEDNSYSNESRPWFMKVIINSDYLLFCSNEIGFNPKDILSICSLSESSKLKGKHIGHKGLGFKSVFLCSNNPIIISKPHWQFQFIKSNEKDEIAYITPVYLDTSDIPVKLSEHIQQNEKCNTFIYLPLKEIYKYSESKPNSKKYFEDILSNINKYVLLFTKNIERVTIEDKINGIQTIINCEKKLIKNSNESRSSSSSIDYLNSTFSDIKINEAVIRVEKKKLSNPNDVIKIEKTICRLCQSKIQIPNDLAMDEGFKQLESEITLAFPQVDELQQHVMTHLPVFAFLPVCDLGFKFLINCYWSLVTNRESINEHALINTYFRDQLANFFVWNANSDEWIKRNLHFYLPKQTADVEMSDWWKLFVDDIRCKMKPTINSIIISNLSCESFKTRIRNEKLDEFVDEEILNLIGIKLIDSNLTKINECDLEYYGLKKLSILDILDCFRTTTTFHENINSSSIHLSEWKRTRNSEWWEKLFRLLNLEASNLNDLNKLKELNIFLIRNETTKSSSCSNDERVRVAIREIISDKQEVKYFLYENKNFTMWRNQLKIVDYESNAERKFLTEILKLPELEINDIFELIHLSHMLMSDDTSQHNISHNINQQQIWQDLEFIKSNYDSYLNYGKRDGLFVPVVAVAAAASATNKSIYLPIKSAKLPSILGIDLNNLPMKKAKENDIIDFGSFGCDLTLKKLLEWENFLLDLGCSLPLINLTKIKIRLELKEKLPSYKDFNQFDPSDIRMASRLIEKIEKLSLNMIQVLNYLPIRATYKNEENMYISISNVCVKSTFNNQLPCIDVPDYALHLCQKLGVTVKLDFAGCFKVLKTLAEEKYQNADIYIEWFHKLKPFINDNNNKNNYDIMNIPVIYLNNIFDENSGDFYSLSQIYCCDHDKPGILTVCEYMRKTLISLKYNNIFKSIETILISLGCETEPKLTDALECMQIMSQEKNLFINQSVQNYLSVKGYENIKEIYLLLEDILVKKLKDLNITTTATATATAAAATSSHKQNRYDLNDRSDLVKLLNGKDEFCLLDQENIKKFSLVTFDHHLVVNNNTSSYADKILVCFQANILNELKERLSNNCLFFDPTIAKLCPYTLAYLQPDYLQTFLSIYLEHLNSNMEETNKYLNSKFKELTKLDGIEVLRVKYIAISAGLIKNQKTSTTGGNREETTEESKFLIWNNMQFAILDKKWVVCACKGALFETQLAIYCSALKYLLKIINPSRDDDELNEMARDALISIKYELNEKFNWQIWENASKEPTKFNLNDILFPDNDYDVNQLSEIYFTGNDLDLENKTGNQIDSTNRKKYISHSYLADEDTYDQRVKEIDKLIVNDRTEIEDVCIKTASNYVNTESQKRIGIKAEHFFCRYLKSKYGDSFNEFDDWVSSNRQYVYPSLNHSFDDRLGYDFKIKDLQNLFSLKSTASGRNVKTCFIEVKGSEGPWDGKFHITQNEMEKRKQTDRSLESYIVVIVDNVSNREKINISRIIDWTNENLLVKLKPESYLATYNLLPETEPSHTMQQQSANNNPKGKGVEFKNQNQIQNKSMSSSNRAYNNYGLNNTPSNSSNHQKSQTFYNSKLNNQRNENPRKTNYQENWPGNEWRNYEIMPAANAATNNQINSASNIVARTMNNPQPNENNVPQIGNYYYQNNQQQFNQPNQANNYYNQNLPNNNNSNNNNNNRRKRNDNNTNTNNQNPNSSSYSNQNRNNNNNENSYKR